MKEKKEEKKNEKKGFIRINILKPKPRRHHRVAHRAAHRREPGEIGGVVEMLISENVSDDDVVEKAGDGLARVSRVGRVSIAALPLFLSRASFPFLPDIALEEWMVCVRVVCVSLCVVVPRRRGFPESVIPGGCRERKIADKKSPLRATVVGRRGLVAWVVLV